MVPNVGLLKVNVVNSETVLTLPQPGLFGVDSERLDDRSRAGSVDYRCLRTDRRGDSENIEGASCIQQFDRHLQTSSSSAENNLTTTRKADERSTALLSMTRKAIADALSNWKQLEDESTRK